MLCIIKLLQPIKLTLTRKWLKWCNDVVLADIYSLPSQTGYLAWWIYGDWIFFWKRRQQQWNRVSPSLAMWRLSNTSFLITSFVLLKSFILHLFQFLWKIWLSLLHLIWFIKYVLKNNLGSHLLVPKICAPIFNAGKYVYRGRIMFKFKQYSRV